MRLRFPDRLHTVSTRSYDQRYSSALPHLDAHLTPSLLTLVMIF